MVLQLLKMLADADKSACKDVASLQLRNLGALWNFLVASTEGSEMFPPVEGHCGRGRVEVSP